MTPHATPHPACPDRWHPHRKAEVCRLVISGEATFDEVAARHQLSSDELRGWIERYERWGVAGLSVTKLQEVGRHG